MAPTAAVAHGLQARAWLRAAQRCVVAAAVFLVASLASGSCLADPVRGEASLTVAGGYARLVVRLAEDVESEVTTAGSILVIHYKQPVDVSVDKLSDAAPDYVGSARRDPDGMAIRLALSRKVTINSMAAGERLFVDFLPDTWKGLPPGLPQEVVKELADRARAAERALRIQRASEEAMTRPPIRVRASVQPTFVRFLFELPDGTGVNTVLNEKKLALKFNSMLNFDLADAKLAAPSNVASIVQKSEGETSTVEVALIGDVDVHSFREERNYIVDIGFQQPEKPSILAKPPVVAGKAPPGAANKPAGEAPRQSSEIAPPTSESIARQARLEIKSEAAAKAEPAAKSETAAKPETMPRVEPKAESKAEPAIKAEPATKAEPTAMGETKSEPAVAPKSEPVARTEPQARTEPTAKPSAAPAEPPATAAPAKPATKEPAVAAATPKTALPVSEPAANIPVNKAIANAGSVDAQRSSDSLRMNFSFASPAPAALFRRAEVVWLVFDSVDPVDVEPIRKAGGSLVADVKQISLENGQAIRIRLNRPQLASLRSGDEAATGKNWVVTLADSMLTPAQPLAALRNIADPAHATVTVPISQPGLLHRLVDPDAGDALMVITAQPPARGFAKRQDFVEFSLLESIQGVVVAPNSDEVVADVGADKVTLSRPGGLTISPATAAAQRASVAVRPIFDVAEWRKNQQQPLIERLRDLQNAAAQASGKERTPLHFELARFYMARGMYPEAKAALDLVLEDEKPGQDFPAALMTHAIANILMGRPEDGLKDLANPVIATNYDATLWKGLAYVRQQKWAEAREKFKDIALTVTSLPVDLQRIVVADEMRASLKTKDYTGAADRSGELDLLEIPPDVKPRIEVMQARLDEALGHDKDALAKYHDITGSTDRQAASEAKLHEIAMLQTRGEMSQDEALHDLEVLAVTWRGDDVELKTLQMLARIYAKVGRYSEALAAARTTTNMAPDSEITRQMEDEAAALFSQLFLSQKGDDLPLIDALALFYEYRELTPIGRRGDEMIRRLADRLVAVDLLDQASELLQYQVDHRLEGAARAQVASRLATVYLMNRKPDRAIAALRSTRINDLAGELRQQRLLLEARAQSDIGRRDLALDIIANVGGREAVRLRSDIYWSARRWREASEQIELYYGDRWRDFKPLNTQEKGDVIRAVLGYSLSEDAIGLARFREKYSPLMSAEKDRAIMEAASKPATGNNADFAQIAKLAAGVDTLDGFLRDMRQRFPDNTAKAILPPDVANSDPVPTGSLPAIAGVRQVPLTR